MGQWSGVFKDNGLLSLRTVVLIVAILLIGIGIALGVMLATGCSSPRIPAAYLRATTDAERAAAWPEFHRTPTPGKPNCWQSD